jgi:hypothetical protein
MNMKNEAAGVLSEDRGLTLRDATQRFLDGALPESVLADAESGDESARQTMKMMRAFQEGAFWACWLIYRDLCHDAPRTMDLLCEILEEHARVRDIVQKGWKGSLN